MEKASMDVNSLWQDLSERGPRAAAVILGPVFCPLKRAGWVHMHQRKESPCPTILLPGFLGTGPPLPQELVAWEKAQLGENEEVVPSSPLPGAHLSNSGFSPQSKESCRSLTRLAWPGMRKSPSSVSPRSRMKSTHCSTSRGARRGPYFRSW